MNHHLHRFYSSYDREVRTSMVSFTCMILGENGRRIPVVLARTWWQPLPSLAMIACAALFFSCGVVSKRHKRAITVRLHCIGSPLREEWLSYYQDSTLQCE